MDRGLRSRKSVGRYELVRPIGSGGAGTVYEALDRTLERRVALKILHGAIVEDASNQRAIARFLREGRAAAQVRHPHIVTVYDAGIDAGSPFLVMEFVEGETLAQLLRREGRLTVSRAIEILLPLSWAVADLHAAAILHRDLKPANILMARGNELNPKVADFGVSRVEDGRPSITRSGAIIGTPEYLAPELLRGTEGATERSDQYALGVILYECVSGEKPFCGSTIFELMRSVVRARPFPPSVHAPSLPKALDGVVLRAMHPEPQRRFASVDDFAGALLAFTSDDVAARWRTEFAPPDDESSEDGDSRLQPVVRTTSSPAVMRSPYRRGPALAAMTAALATSALFLGLRGGRSPDPGRKEPGSTAALGRNEPDAPSADGGRPPPPAALGEGAGVSAPAVVAVPWAPALVEKGNRAMPAVRWGPQPSPRLPRGPNPLTMTAAGGAAASSSALPPTPRGAALKGDNGAPILDVP